VSGFRGRAGARRCLLSLKLSLPLPLSPPPPPPLPLKLTRPLSLVLRNARGGARHR
jgi:hypothetical protein